MARNAPGSKPIAVDVLLTPADVAQVLRVSTRQIRAMTRAGRLPAPLRIGRLPRWRPADLDSFVSSLIRQEVAR